MLHALIQGKLDPALPEPQRLEDALTSTVFGTLAMVEGWNLMARWLGVDLSPGAVDDNAECWFWPRLAGGVEPDVVLRLGHVLIVVEAKYRSGRHDLTLDDPDNERPVDQIVRQYRAVSPPHDFRPVYPEQLEEAVRQCRIIQAFVVDARRIRRARREQAESQALLPAGAKLNLVTWQGLYRILLGSPWSGSRWAVDLRTYLALIGLATFSGIGHRISEADHLAAVADWNPCSRRTIVPGVRVAGAMLAAEPAIADLSLWQSSSTRNGRTEESR